MKVIKITLFIILSSSGIYCQYSSIDTVIWKHNAGFREELYQFDSLFVEEIIAASDVYGCDTVVSFLHYSQGVLGEFDGFVNGFSDEIRVYAFELSILEGKCITELLDNLAITTRDVKEYRHEPTKLSKFPFLEELHKNIGIYMPAFTKLLTTTNYQLSYREHPDLFARKNIALLLDKVAKSLPAKQVELLSEKRRDYINSLLLSPELMEEIKNPLSKLPNKL